MLRGAEEQRVMDTHIQSSSVTNQGRDQLDYTQTDSFHCPIQLYEI